MYVSGMYLEKPEKNIRNEDLSNRLFVYWENLDTSVKKLAGLVKKIYTFSVATKNLLKEMKGWCTELYQQTAKSKKKTKQ